MTHVAESASAAPRDGLRFDHRTLEQRVVFGAGTAVDSAVSAIAELGAGRPLIISSASAERTAAAIAVRFAGSLRIRGVRQHVPVEDAVEATRRATDGHADAVVSVGGGSATGLAKAVGLRTAAPIVAVPTTFAGSEATDVWGSTEEGRKRTGSDPRVLPKIVVYDPTLFRSLPDELAASSGMNALAHAVEALWGPRADPINAALSTAGLRPLVRGLRGLRGAGRDAATEDLLYGAYLAAVGFASAGAGLHHKVCHVLGGRFGLSHSGLHSVMLGYVTAFNVSAASDAASILSRELGGELAESAIFALRDEIGAPRSLAALGLAASDLPAAVEECARAVPPSNPRPVTQEDMKRILDAAWAGDPVTRGRL